MFRIDAAAELFFRFFSSIFMFILQNLHLEKIEPLKILEKELTRKKKVDARWPETEEVLFYLIESLWFYNV